MPNEAGPEGQRLECLMIEHGGGRADMVRSEIAARFREVADAGVEFADCLPIDGAHVHCASGGVDRAGKDGRRAMDRLPLVSGTASHQRTL